MEDHKRRAPSLNRGPSVLRVALAIIGTGCANRCSVSTIRRGQILLVSNSLIDTSSCDVALSASCVLDVARLTDCAVATHTTLKERLEEVVKHAGVKKAAELERRANLHRGYLSRPLSGERTFLAWDHADRLGEVTGISTEWIMSGRGEKFRVADGDGTASRARAPVAAEPKPDPRASALASLETALSFAFDGTRHHIRDCDAVRAVLRDSLEITVSDTELREAARLWLDAAMELRLQGMAVTVGTLMLRVTLDLCSHRASPDEVEVSSD
jgi:hypothetical protein